MKGFLIPVISLHTPPDQIVGNDAIAHQSVSSTTAVWPRNRGILSGNLPRSWRGITAKAPPPPASQFTDR